MALTPKAFEALSRVERMQTIAKLFPSLRDKKGIDPWDPEAILKWAWKSGGNQQAKTSAKLLLTLWAPQGKWPWGKFDFITALRTWDSDHLWAVGCYIQDYACIEPASTITPARRRRG